MRNPAHPHILIFTWLALLSNGGRDDEDVLCCPSKPEKRFSAWLITLEDRISLLGNRCHTHQGAHIILETSAQLLYLLYLPTSFLWWQAVAAIRPTVSPLLTPVASRNALL